MIHLHLSCLNLHSLRIRHLWVCEYGIFRSASDFCTSDWFHTHYSLTLFPFHPHLCTSLITGGRWQYPDPTNAAWKSQVQPANIKYPNSSLILCSLRQTFLSMFPFKDRGELMSTQNFILFRTSFHSLPHFFAFIEMSLEMCERLYLWLYLC